MDLLARLVELEQEAHEFGFRWENTTQIMTQIQSECAEVNEHLQQGITLANQDDLEEEIGDLLHAVFSLCVFCNLNPNDTLQKTISKFDRRLRAVKQIAQAQGLTELKGFAFDDLMQFWEQAKKEVG